MALHKWLLMPHGGPYRQARTASATLRRLVKDHTNPAVASMVNHIKFVSAVWFPDMAQDRVNRIPFGSDANKKSRCATTIWLIRDQP